MNEQTPPLLTFHVQLSATRRGARLARLLCTEQLRSWELPLDPARQIVAELALNAATHGRVPGRDFRCLMYVVGDLLHIEMVDTRDDRRPQLREPCTETESGRGLRLVDSLAERWGVWFGPAPMKTVWAEVRVRGDRVAGNRVPVAGAPVGREVTP